MKSPAHSWTQQWAIIRRTLIKMRRKPISNLVCVLILPALIVGGVTRLIYHTGENNDRGLTEPLSYVSLVTLFIAAYNVFELANSLVADKATGMKSLMMSMGLSRVNYYCGKSITFLVFTLPFTLLLAIVTKLYLLDSHVSYLTIVSLFTLFTLHLDAAVAASVSLITATNFVFITILLVQGSHIVLELLIWYTGLSTSSSLPVVLFFASASPYLVVDCFFGKYLKDHGAEDQQKQLCSQETHLLLAAQIFWIVYFRLFAYWFEEVCPWQKFTSPRGFLFCLKRDKTAKQEDEDQGHSLELVSSMGSKYFEQRFSSESSTNVGIEAKRLRKTFGGEQVAVNDVSFTIYKGETTLLLGHNGAGKSTLMNMILGLLEPNDGYVEFKNREGDIVPAVGVCPQASILDDDLTVKEHLELFNDIKSNLSGNERARHIAQTIGDVSLAGQESKRPQELSGGMKRKLSLGAAFVGQSDVLILDEPSSGLDPDSRISIWNAIRRYRSERTVLLSTQHMEEADYLGDRIAIMSAGRIICCGSSVFLNKMFGTGYKLRLECRSSKREQILAHIREHYFDAVQPMEDSLDPLTRTNADPFVDYVVELATSDENKDSELELIKLLEDLENNAETLSVRSYGLKSSSIEDVMLNTGKHFTPTNQKVGQTATSKAGHLATIAGIRNSSNVSPFDLLWALIIKHLQVYRAEWFNVSVQKLLVPFIGILFLPAILPQPTDELWQNPRVALIVAHLMYFPARDLGSKFKIVQLNSNATVWLYWLAHALTDLIWLIIPMVRIPIYVSNWDCITPIGYWPMVFMLELALFAFYLASMLFCYCLSFVIKPRFAITSFYFISIASLITFGIAYLIIAILFKSNPYWATKTISNIGIFLLPTDAFVYIFAGLRGKCYVRFKDDCIPIAGPSQVLIGFAGLAVQVVLYSSMLYLIERRTINIEWYCRLKNLFPFFNRSRVNATETGEVDQDVVEETNEAMAAINNVNGPHSLVASRLNKSYIRNKKIIADLSFTVNKSECFGLLGVNGAGKTTTFSMLATDSSPDSGRILGNGHYENSDLHKYRAGFGYDPQATPEMSLSPYQALSLMARLRGVDGSSIAQVVRSVLDLLDMSEHAHKPDGKLSGGTKRKLALGMALIGNPAILLLDEPTAGVDPLARRSVWQLLKSLRAHNASSIVISSHAMEECEAICDRIAIMARGRLRCIGTFLHLRSKFAKGCTLRVQSVTDELIDELQQQLVAAIGASVLTLADKSVNSATFNITDNRVRRSILFCTMREFRQKHPNVSYMFNDSSLEDIFVSLAREQEDVDKRKEQS